MLKEDNVKYIYGPVFSRRLGYSLGVDVVPKKLCSFNCIYCQVGETTEWTVHRKKYGDIARIISEISLILTRRIKIDFITLAGSGEPTLNVDLGRIIDDIHLITDIPVALLTNSSLLWQEDVIKDCMRVDYILPSLDAARDSTFKRINNPCEGLNIERIIDGLIKFTAGFKGKVWLEILFIKGVNDTDEELDAFMKVLPCIRIDEIHLNTVTRPPRQQDCRALSEDRLIEIAAKFETNIGIKTKVVGFSSKCKKEIYSQENVEERIIDILQRRPSTVEDISLSLGCNPERIRYHVDILVKKGLLEHVDIEGKDFYKCKS